MRKLHLARSALAAALGLTVGAPIARADPISDFQAFLAQIPVQEQNPFGAYSYADMSAGSDTGLGAVVNGFSGSFTQDQNSQHVSSSGTASALCGNAGLPPQCEGDPNRTVTADGQSGADAVAHAQFGSLGAHASGGGSIVAGFGPQDVAGGGQGDARFWDTIQIAPSKTRSGVLQFSATLDGELAATTSNNQMQNGAGAGVTVALGTRSFVANQISASLQYNQSDLVETLPAGFNLQTGAGSATAGGAVPLELKLPYSAAGFDGATGLWLFAPVFFYIDLSVDGYCHLEVNEFDGSGSCTGNADYNETLQVTGLEALDLSGQPVTDTTLTAASGFDYNAASNPGSVPEPATLGLLITGIAFLIGVRRRDFAVRRCLDARY